MDILGFQIRERLGEQLPGGRLNSTIFFDENKNKYISRRPVRYIDFTVNGNSIASLIDADLNDIVGSMQLKQGEEQFFGISTHVLEILQFKFPFTLKYNRVPLFVCPECGYDENCGSVTFELAETEDQVIWRHFGSGFETEATSFMKEFTWSALEEEDFEFWIECGKSNAILEKFKGSRYEWILGGKPSTCEIDSQIDLTNLEYPEIGPFTFKKKDYFNVLSEIESTLKKYRLSEN
ncbi:MAG TPA: hypothetical protein PK079_05195 [Leptospiraceae bacterium]|nr:hypothetical protein [Leptospiraceae bacterium]HMW06267.1 hypothetical protein [Leptospiraceae bacterium]HMX33172.1 hypothetical protein [Leptospiraceae bacterium]HMY31729.1 hypothetical protein [Leptospiraceae bacterium]HMZ64522.1 hypothetical protein [Leptospiraceae bacterium]